MTRKITDMRRLSFLRGYRGPSGIIQFDGRGDAAALGKHTDQVATEEVRALAKWFVSADFYSMDASYVASIT